MQEVDVPAERCLEAAQDALRSLKVAVSKQVQKGDIIQIVGKYNDGRKFWIDIRTIEYNLSKISVRVGAAAQGRCSPLAGTENGQDGGDF